MQALIHDGDAVRTTTSADDVEEAVRAGKLVWVDTQVRADATDRLLDQVFQLHPLVVEDLWGDRALPKIDRYDDYLFVLLHGVRAGSNSREVELTEIDIVVGKRFLLTHHDGSRAVSSVFQQASRTPGLLGKGPGWLLHAVVDELVDHYIPVLDEFEQSLDALEAEVLEATGAGDNDQILTRILAFKRSLQVLRRQSLHQREILLRLSKGEFSEIPKAAMPFFRDVYDHFARVTDIVDGYRELVSSALDAYFSVQSNRMGEVMKTLTLMSTIMLPLTFIAGVYGMNFERMPEVKWAYGYPFALGLMLIVATGIVMWFRRKGLL